MRFFVKLTDTREQRTKTSKPVQEPFLLYRAMTKLIFVCIVAASLLFPMDPPGEERNWDPQSPLTKQGNNVVIKADVGSVKCVWC